MSRTSVRLFVVLTTSLFFSACVNTVRVYDGVKTNKRHKVPGVLFYAKEGVYKQSTIYRRSYHRVTMQVTEVTDPPIGQAANLRQERKRPPMVQNVPSSPTGLQAISDLRAVLSKSGITENEARDKFVALPAMDFSNWQWNAMPVSNSVVLTAEVDYETKYYINARASWFGSASLNTELNADGTLSKTEATVEPGVAESIADIVPFKEFLESEYIPAQAVAEGAPGAQLLNRLVTEPERGQMPTEWVRFSLDVEEIGELATFERVLSADPRGGATAPLPLDFANGQFSTRPLKASDPAPTANANSWTVTGSLTPPKAAATE